MENASKALLIAGAILICILLIAIGMYVYNAAKGTITTAASQMTQQDKNAYNAMIQQYIGSNKSGSEVKQMIAAVISQNDQYIGESGKFISILATDITNFDNSNSTTNMAELKTACNNANVYAGGNNDKTNVDAAKTQMNGLSDAIAYGKKYIVTEETEDGIIHTVTITPATTTTSP